MPKVDPNLTRLRKICLSLPDTEETPTWGQPHFRVCNKIFAGFGDHKGVTTIGFKLPMALADMVIEEPYFSRAPYVGQHGWVSLDIAGAKDWRRIESMILTSYGLIAPKRTLAKLESAESGAPAPGKIKTPRPGKQKQPSKQSKTRKKAATTGSGAKLKADRKAASRNRK